MAGEAVLVVEDELKTRSFLEQQLTDDGFDVVSADRGGRALELVECVDPDLVLLDVRLPDASGFEVCRRLREGEPGRAWNRDVPVILVSERGDPVDRVRGFARGCDDYVVRPFVYEELLARMRAVLRRAAGPARREQIRVGEIELDRLSRTVRVSGHSVFLSAKEYDLLVRARRGARARLQEGGAPSRRLGFPQPWPDADSRLPREPAAPQAQRPRRQQVRGERLGGRLPARRAGDLKQEARRRSALSGSRSPSWARALGAGRELRSGEGPPRRTGPRRSLP